MVYIVRFLIGGVFVSLFSFIGETIRPKSFAGLFGAAPSVALATLALTLMKDGKGFATSEASSMWVGAIGFFIYALLVSRFMLKRQWSALKATSILIPVWFLSSIPLWFAFIG